MRNTIVILFLLLSVCLYSQEINPEFFDKIVFSSEFNSTKDTKTWPIANDENELLLIGNGKYVIERKDLQRDRYIFPIWKSAYPNFELNVSFSMENLINTSQSLGICINFNKTLDQGIVIEFNKNKQYRVKEIGESGKITYLSGENASKSWKKSNFLLTKGELNDINLLVSGERVELYINNFYTFSFLSKPKYYSRNFGLFTGRGSTASFYKIHLLVNHKEQGKFDYLLNADEQNNQDLLTKPTTDTMVVKDTSEKIKPKNDTIISPPTAELQTALALIVKLRNELAESQKQLEINKTLLDKCKQDNIALNEVISKNLNNKSQNRISELEKENETLKDQVAKLKIENATLQDFKSFYLNQNKEKDIVNFLYEELKKLEDKNASMARQVEQLQNQIRLLKK